MLPEEIQTDEGVPEESLTDPESHEKPPSNPSPQPPSKPPGYPPEKGPGQ